MFETNPKSLRDILQRVEEGILQLPDFQRDWVWDDEAVRSLLASIAAGFPIGALLTLTTGGDVRFKPRTLAHAPDLNKEPDELLLDGQQRITSCYQALKSRQPVKTKTSKGRQIDVYYFMDMQRALLGTARLESCIKSVPSDLKIKKNFNRDIVLDLSTDASQFENHMFPLNQTFDAMNWFIEYTNFHQNNDPEIMRRFHSTVLSKIENYQIPIIKLTRDNTREAVCTVFEKVNVGGKKLDAFELLTAIFAADEFDLREDMRGTNGTNGRLSRIRGNENNDVFRELSERDVLQVATLLQTFDERMEAKALGETDPKRIPAVSIKAESLLELRCDVYQQKIDSIERGFIKARQFFNQLNITRAWDVPYLPASKTMAALFALKGTREYNHEAILRMERWFWCITLGETYGSSTDTKVARDVLAMRDWLDAGKKLPRSVEETNIHIDRLDLLKTRQAAGYKAINAALLSEGCQDFRTGKPAAQMSADGDPIDIHHIFPRAWCEKNGIGRDKYDTIVNKTPILKQTNQIIGSNAPSIYLSRLEEEFCKYQEGAHDEGALTETFRDLLQTHLIDINDLRENNFNRFYENRKEALAQLIEKKTGTRVIRSEETEDDSAVLDDVPDEGL